MGEIKLSYGTNGIKKYDIHQAIQKLSELDYDAIDLMADRPHAYPPDLDKEKRNKIKETLEETNMKVANINASTVSAIYENKVKELNKLNLPPALTDYCEMYEPSLISQSEECRQLRIEYLKQCIDLAVDMEANCVSTFSGIRLPGTQPEESWNWMINGLQEWINYASTKNIKILLEPEPFHLIERIEDMKRLLKELNSNWFGVNLDIGHSYCIEGSVDALVKAIKDLKAKIGHIHLEDIKNRYHHHIIPGEGDIGKNGLKRIISALKNIGFSQFITVELYTYNDIPEMAAKKSIKVLKEII
ncbi:MAG: sugar phosphate isomerase/epimerase family protein [Promethearchaeota archaeon]